MSYASVAETTEIVDTIRRDLSTVTSITVGDYTVSKFDPHDPLGIAFYVYALLKVGYRNVDVDLYPKTARYWVEEKVNEKTFSPYLDRDLGALGLFTYALCSFKTCPPIQDNFSETVEPYFKDTTGLFNSFIPTVLIGLALNRLSPDSQLAGRFHRYIESQLENNRSAIFNDSKNFFITHLWATERSSERLINMLIHECLLRSSKDECLLRDKIFYSYILLEEIDQLHRKDQLRVQQWVLDSLSFIQTYSQEPSPAPDVLEEFGSDVFFNTGALKEYGVAPKPHPSRIVLAVGLMLTFRYKAIGPEFFTFGRGFNRYFRAFSSAAFPFLLGFLMFWIGRSIGLPLSIKADIRSSNLLVLLKAVILKMLLVNIVWFGLMLLSALSALFAFEGLISRKINNEYEALSYAVNTLGSYWKIEVVLAIIISLAASAITYFVL